MKRRKYPLPLWLLALWPLVLVAMYYHLSLRWGGGEAGVKTWLWLLAVPGPVLALLPRLGRGRLRSRLETAALVLLLLLDVCTTALAAGLFRPDEIAWDRMGIALIGLLYLSLGCEEGKWKPNEYMGIRTRWTLTDPDVWNRTQRLFGWLTFLSGLLVLLSSFLLAEAVTLFLLGACAAVSAAVPAAMSRVWYRHLNPPGGTP